MKRILNNKKGFTLIELMIVVAIIGILSAVAIPNFINFRYKAKSAEAKANLGAIRTCEEAYMAENETYYACAETPSADCGSSKQAWTTDDGGEEDFRYIGFAPTTPVYYQYQVAAVTDITADFIVTATGDLDGDGTEATFTLTNSGSMSVQPSEF